MAEVDYKACARCANPIIGRAARAKYCSELCKHRHNGSRSGSHVRKPNPKRPCKRCGAVFADRQPCAVYCSRLCAKSAWLEADPTRASKQAEQNKLSAANWYAEIKKTDEYRIAKARRRLLSILRLIRADKKRITNSQAIRVKKCKVCSCTLLLGAAHARTELCDTCRDLNWQQSRRKYGRSRRKKYGRDWKSVATVLGVPYERVVRTKVFERDGWRCQICNKPTPRERLGRHGHNEPTIDHRVPITKGGPHTYANIQCACRDCNTKKGNKSSLGQLPMFS